jgi:hypothetical protein
MPVQHADTIGFLRQVTAFSLLGEGELEQLGEQLQMVHYGIGRVICSAGDAADAFYPRGR